MEVKSLTPNQVANGNNSQKGSEIVNSSKGDVKKKDLSLIQKRINEGFYNKEEVLEATAEFILAEIAG